MSPTTPTLSQIAADVARALSEDIGSGDITAELIPSELSTQATIITREHAIICGCAWATESFRQVDPSIHINWLVSDGDQVVPNQALCTLHGAARGMLTAERTALNFLQTLSGTATTTRHYVSLIEDTQTRLLDTRKTLPGMRLAQKYAVRCGGGKNHRIGLYDAYLIKENHIHACGGIHNAIGTARQRHPGKLVEVEVETLEELQQALSAQADIVMLDNFTVTQMCEAVAIVAGKCKLEASGNVNQNTIRGIALTGVDYISIGSITKHLHAIDLSMRIHD